MGYKAGSVYTIRLLFVYRSAYSIKRLAICGGISLTNIHILNSVHTETRHATYV